MKPIINLMLGTACNRNCSYCMQPRQGSNGKVDIDSFLDKLIPYLKAHYPNGLQTIEYWGGEPLLYFEYIKKIQAAFKQMEIQKNAYLQNLPRLQSRIENEKSKGQPYGDLPALRQKVQVQGFILIEIRSYLC